LKHEHRVEGRPPAFASRAAAQRCHQRTAEHLEVDHRRKSLQRITRRAQLLISGRKIEETRLSNHRCLRCRAQALNHAQASNTMGFSRCPDFKKINAADRLYQFIREEKPHFRFRIRRSDLFKPYYVIPKMNNNRIIAQSGAFIAFGLEWRSDPSPEKGIWNYSIRIPKDCKGPIRDDLKLLGIHSGTIFPELGKAAAEIVHDLSS